MKRLFKPVCGAPDKIEFRTRAKALEYVQRRNREGRPVDAATAFWCGGGHWHLTKSKK